MDITQYDAVKINKLITAPATNKMSPFMGCNLCLSNLIPIVIKLMVKKPKASKDKRLSVNAVETNRATPAKIIQLLFWLTTLI